MIRYSTGGGGCYLLLVPQGRALISFLRNNGVFKTALLSLDPYQMPNAKNAKCLFIGQDVQSSNRYKLWCTRHTFEAHWNGGIIEMGVLIGIMALINKNTFKGGGAYSKGRVYWKEGAKSIVSLLISVLSEWGNCNFLDPPPSKISMSSQTFSFTISMPKIDSLRFHKKIPVPCRIS